MCALHARATPFQCCHSRFALLGFSHSSRCKFHTFLFNLFLFSYNFKICFSILFLGCTISHYARTHTHARRHHANGWVAFRGTTIRSTTAAMSGNMKIATQITNTQFRRCDRNCLVSRTTVAAYRRENSQSQLQWHRQLQRQRRRLLHHQIH